MSETHEDLQRAFDTLWSGSEGRSWVKGRLGKVDTDGTIVIKTGRPGFVHVRLGQEGQDGVAIARNLGVPLKPYLPIRMRLEPTKGYLVIHGIDFGSSADTFDGSGGLSHTVGMHTHAIRSGLEYPLEALRFNPGRAQCDSGLVCSIKPFRYYHAGVFDTWEGGSTIDVTSYLPASSKWCWILIGIDPATNTIKAAKGADQTLQTDLTIDLIDAITFPYIPCAAVQATSSDTSLTDIDRWQDGRTWINKHVTALDDVPDVTITTPADGQILYYDNATSEWINSGGTGATVDVAKSFDVYIDVKERLAENEIHGGFNSLATAQPLDSVPTDIIVTMGIGKVVIVINAGSDITGDIVVTGTSVDRDTGAETASDTDTLTIDALTTDGSGTDSNGNTVHSFTGAYITSKWFKGGATLSTTNLTLTDVDVYQVAFEQFGDLSNITLDTLDFSALATNGNAWANVHLYSLEVTGDKCNITEEAEVVIDAADVSANKWYRLRKGAIAKALDGTTDGIWVDGFLGPLANTYWEDINTKVWYTHNASITGQFAASSDHGALAGLDGDDHSGYALLAGRDAEQLIIDSIRAYDGAGLKLFEDGGKGIFIQDSTGYVGINTIVPGGTLELSDATPDLIFTDTDNSDKQWKIINTGGDLRLNEVGVGSALVLEAGGNIGFATSTPAVPFDFNANGIRVRTARAPASNGAGITGEIAWSANYIYVCTSTNVWKRAVLIGGY